MKPPNQPSLLCPKCGWRIFEPSQVAARHCGLCDAPVDGPLEFVPAPVPTLMQVLHVALSARMDRCSLVRPPQPEAPEPGLLVLMLTEAAIQECGYHLILAAMAEEKRRPSLKGHRLDFTPGADINLMFEWMETNGQRHAWGQYLFTGAELEEPVPMTVFCLLGHHPDLAQQLTELGCPTSYEQPD